MSKAKRYCTFALDGLFLGVPVERVQEVTDFREITRVPSAPPIVRGLINLRGQIVMVLDLRRRLQLREYPHDLTPVNVVLRKDDHSLVSLLVDDIEDVVEVDDSFLEHPPETLKGVGRELIREVYKLKNKLLLVLDTNKTIEIRFDIRAKS